MHFSELGRSRFSTLYKSDKIARVNAIVTTMRFGEERIHCQDSGQRVSMSYFRSPGRVWQASLASWGRGKPVASVASAATTSGTCPASVSASRRNRFVRKVRLSRDAAQPREVPKTSVVSVTDGPGRPALRPGGKPSQTRKSIISNGVQVPSPTPLWSRADRSRGGTGAGLDRQAL